MFGEIPERHDLVDPVEYPPPIAHHCEICGEPIYAGDDHYPILGAHYCLECIENAKTEAVYIDWAEGVCP